jgi:DNA-binding CsgD family transcriptional regulator
MFSVHDQFLLDLYRASHGLPAQELSTYLMDLLCRQLPFDSARLVTVTPPIGGVPMQMHGAVVHNEPLDMVLDWESINREDVVLQQVLTRPGTAHIFHAPTLYAGADKSIVLDYAQRYGHLNGLVIGAPAAEPGQMDGLSLYRADPDQHFSPADRALVECWMAHVQNALAINRQLAIAAAGLRCATHALAIVTAHGAVQFSTAGFQAAISHESARWSPVRLPACLMDAIQAGKPGYHGRRSRFSFKASGGVVVVAAAATAPDGQLTPREAQVAALFAEGRSYKEAARTLGIAPSTARNLLQNAYRKLGVRDKGALATYLAHQGLSQSAVRGS